MQTTFHRILFLSVFIFIAGNALAQTGLMTTVAGTGTGGYNGDGLAARAWVNSPYSVKLDATGNLLYIADKDNHRIRKVDLRTGQISTVAGQEGDPQFAGEGVPAVLAFLNNAQDVVADAAGNLYVADAQNHRIRRVSAAGVITTFAGTGKEGSSGDGGPAISAELNRPTGVAVDSAGNVFIADQANNRIRKVTIKDNMTITTYVNKDGIRGFGGDKGPAFAAQLDRPVHIAIDSADNLYIADTQNHRIRKVDAKTGTISTLAGTQHSTTACEVGDPRCFSGDGGPATEARLNNPYDVAVDAARNIYIADSWNRRIRRVDAKTGVIQTVAGGGINNENCPALMSSLKVPVGVVVNLAGTRIYIADVDDNRIRTVALTDTISPPTLTMVDPSSGTRGATISAMLTGTGFSLPAGSGCKPSEPKISINPGGVEAREVKVMRDGISATLYIAPDARLGERKVTVVTEQGTSNSYPFTVTTTASEPDPLLTSIAPASGRRGSTTLVTLTGSRFDLPPASTRVVVNTNAISVTDVSVTSTTSLTASFNIAADAPLRDDYEVSVVTAGGTSNPVAFAVNPQGPPITYGLPPLLNPTEQVPVQLALGSLTPDPVTGRLTLTFVPNATNNADDPGVLLINAQTSTRTVDFTFPTNSTTAQFSLPGVLLRAGTVAGAMRLTITDAKVGGRDVTISNNTYDVTVPRLVPMITNLRILNRTPSGFDVEITGYSTTRDITTASFQFAGTPGGNLQTSEVKLDLTSQFTAYYQSANSAAVGSTFVYIQPFTVQGDANAIGSVTVTLSNAQGVSLPKTAN